MLASTLVSGRKRKQVFDEDEEEDEKDMNGRLRSREKVPIVKLQGG